MTRISGALARRNTTESTTPQNRRGLTTALAAGLMLLVALFLTAPAAQAHDQLVSSDPAQNASVSEAPQEITLTYSADITKLGNAIKVTDSHGKTVSTGDVKVDGPKAIQKITPAEGDETYTVTWRVVSSDGHPIEGAYAFTVGKGGTGDQTAAPSAPAEDHDHEDSESAGADHHDSTDKASDSQDSDSQNASDFDGLPTWAVALIGAVAAVVVVSIVLLVVANVRRSRSKK